MTVVETPKPWAGVAIAGLMIIAYMHLVFEPGGTKPVNVYVQPTAQAETPKPTPQPATPDQTSKPSSVAPNEAPLVAILTLPNTPPELTPALAELMVDPIVRAAMFAHGTEFRAFLVGSNLYTAPEYNAAINQVGGPPCVVWSRGGSSVTATKVTDRSSILNELAKVGRK